MLVDVVVVVIVVVVVTVMMTMMIVPRFVLVDVVVAAAYVGASFSKSGPTCRCGMHGQKSVQCCLQRISLRQRTWRHLLGQSFAVSQRVTSSFEAKFYICLAHKCSSLQCLKRGTVPPSEPNPFLQRVAGPAFEGIRCPSRCTTHQLQASVRRWLHNTGM